MNRSLQRASQRRSHSMLRSNSHWSGLWPGMVLALALSLPVGLLAQDNVGNDSTVLYPASYFTEFSPVTALDMVNRIPGMDVSSNDGGGGNASRGGRGLGSGGSGTLILIDGKRTAGKNNNTAGQLDRIMANQVEYIELIRGTGGELDVRGGTQIANIVLYEQQSSSTISYEVNADYYHDSEYQPGGSLTYSGQSGELDYLFSASAEPRYDHQVAFEESILGDFNDNDLVNEDRIREQTTYQFSTNLGYQFSLDTSARFNAQFSEMDDPTSVTRQTIDLRNNNALRLERETIPGERTTWEIGTDFEHSFANGSRFKFLAIANEDDASSIRERYDVLSDGSENKTLYLNSANVITERIARASYTTDLMPGHDLEVGAEAAKTTLDAFLRLGLPSSTGAASPDHGGLVAQDVNNANTTVEEFRYEPFAIHNWQINPRMSLESSLVYENSEIEQSGEFNQSREFSFVKPKIDYRFNVTPQLQLRMLVEKNVRQINFVDFVAVTDTTDEDSNTLAGNRNLRPDYFWNYNFLTEYRFADDVGVVSANLYKHRHYDFRQRIDVSTSSTELASAVGNIGKGDMLVLELNSSIRMIPLNMPNLLVTSSVSVRESEVRDPFQNIDRSFDNFDRGRFQIGFRHDIPSLRLNYGYNWNNRFEGDIMRYDIEDVESFSGDPMATAFVQWVGFENTTFRFDVRNLTDGVQCRERERFVGHIRDGILEELEKRCWGSGRVLTFRMSGTF
ncbi:MAG: TonB-dependent receptor plug domain-containing protein [Gammaproteobacteria bacterium]